MDPEVYEKLGLFYLGRHYDMAAGEPLPAPLLYSSRDLLTHALVVGMTGSGKTGLCISLLEEAAIDGIPALIIDPKGDLGNLLLTFPDLATEDFLPWIEPEDAARRGVSVEALAEQRAELWRRGLAEWGQSPERIARLREAAEFAIYTPGSTAGRPLSVLSSLEAPSPELAADPELLGERVGATASSLLGLLGIDADPVRSREHILLSTLLTDAWRQGRSLDLPGLIREVQQPPVSQVGVLDLESFFPSRDRFALAMALNNLLASPTFATWLQGEPLDPSRLLYTDTGAPRVSICSIAHLSEPERMFFVTLLLGQTLSWMRGRPGTTNLRAILYMDEIFGYLPPVAEPPSKRLLLTMLKQARAYGLGIVLATQNPGDVDYKALANIGTWVLGRLQAERDKQRLMDGLEGAARGAAGGAGAPMGRRELDTLLSSLRLRLFLLHNVHAEAPVVFESRWAMSYLKGPLTREEIRHLTADGEALAAASPAALAAPAAPEAAAPPAATPAPGAAAAPPAPAPAPLGALATPAAAAAPTPAPPPAAAHAAPAAPSPIAQARPLLPPGITERWAPSAFAAQRPHLRPALVGSAVVEYRDGRRGLDHRETVTLVAELPAREAGDLAWSTAQAPPWKPADLLRQPPAEAAWGPLPPPAANPRSYPAWEQALARHLQAEERLTLLRSNALGVTSQGGESEKDFRIRLGELAREERERKADAVRQRFARRAEQLAGQIARAQDQVASHEGQLRQQKMQTAISMGAAVLSAVLGQKKVTAGTLGRTTTAARGATRTQQRAATAARARERLAELQTQEQALEAELEQEMHALETGYRPDQEPLEEIPIRPARGGVRVELLALLWQGSEAR